MKLIGITGKAQSGKDSIAKHLWSQHGFTRIALADPLKLAAQQMFALSRDQTWADEVKEDVIPYWGLSPRQIFQLLGTEAAKNAFGPDIWVKRWARSYNILADTDNVVVPDVRFDVEAEYLRSRGGVIIEVKRGTGLNGSTGSHASELGLSTLPDFSLSNEGSFDELFASIDKIMEGL